MSQSRILKNILLASLAISSSAIAAPTGSVTLGGSVSTTLDMTVNPKAAASALNLSTGQKIVLVADLAMITNNDQGLTLTATQGSLIKTGAGGAGASIPFQVTTVVVGAAAVEATFPTASGTDFVASESTAAGAVTKDLYIMYTPGATQDPGTYAGSISLTVSDN